MCVCLDKIKQKRKNLDVKVYGVHMESMNW